MIPQFEINFYPSQIFYTTLSFIFCYSFPVKILLNKLSRLLEKRNSYILNNLKIADDNVVKVKNILKDIDRINKRNIFDRKEINANTLKEIDIIKNQLDEDLLKSRNKIREEVKSKLISKIDSNTMEQVLVTIVKEFINKIDKSKNNENTLNAIKSNIKNINLSKKISNIIELNLLK